MKETTTANLRLYDLTDTELQELVKHKPHNDQQRLVCRLAQNYLALKAKLAVKQATIDMLMLEHCPKEMTNEQMAEWAKCQVEAYMDKQP